MADDQTMRDHIEDLMEVEAKLRRHIDWLRDELKKAEAERDQWRNRYEEVTRG